MLALYETYPQRVNNLNSSVFTQKSNSAAGKIKINLTNPYDKPTPLRLKK